MASKKVAVTDPPTPRRKPPRAGMGRPKGAVNKTTAAVKEALQLAFQGLGGVKRLQAWADDNPTEFFKLWAKMLPQEVSGEGGGPVRVTVTFEDAT